MRHNGRTNSVSDSRGTTMLAYETGDDRVSSVTDPVTGTTGYTYGMAGQRATMTLPGGGTRTYTTGTEIQPKADPNNIGFAVGEIQDDGGRTVQFGVGMHGELCQVISNVTYNGSSIVSYCEADYYPEGRRSSSPASGRLQQLTNTFYTYANNAWTGKTLSQNVYTYDTAGDRLTNAVTDNTGTTRTVLVSSLDGTS